MKVKPLLVAFLGASVIPFGDASTGMEEGSRRALRALLGSTEAEVKQMTPEAQRKMEVWYRRGKCCNSSGGTEYALVDGVWQPLPPGQCVGGWWSSDDCEGMTCGGGFYYVDGSTTGTCVTPGYDSGVYTNRRWSPNPGESDGGARSPSQRGGPDDNGPPGYPYGPRPTSPGPAPGPAPAPTPASYPTTDPVSYPTSVSAGPVAY